MTVAANPKTSSREAFAVMITILLCVFSTAPFLVLPVVIAVMRAAYALSDAEIGSFASALMAGGPIGSIITMLCLQRVSWGLFARVSLGLFAFGFAISLFTHSFSGLIAGMLLASSAGGAAYALGLAAIAKTEKADRNFGICVAAQVAFQVGGMLLLPAFVEGGKLPLVLALIAPCIGLIPLMGLLPKPSASAQPETQVWLPKFDRKIAFALLGCFAFFFNIGIVWTFVEPFASGENIPPAELANTLALGVSAGILGALASGPFLARWHLSPAIIGAAIGSALAIALMLMRLQPFGFLAGAALYNVFWNFGLSQQYSQVARLDDEGRALALVPAVQGAGAALAPASLAFILGEGAGYDAMFITSAIAAIISGIFLLLGQKKERPKG